MDFSSVVKQVREKLGISQEELAHELKVSVSTINRWENGKTCPNKLAKSVFFSFCKEHSIVVETLLQENLQTTKDLGYGGM